MSQFNFSSLSPTSILGSHTLANYKEIDLSVNGNIALSHAENWFSFLTNLPNSQPKVIHFGGYLEKRFFYSNEQLFGKGQSRRDIHLGVDIWLPSQTYLFAPLDARVHSIAYNAAILDYGHTIILKHELHGREFFTLYGHLSKDHVNKLKANDRLSQGQQFCSIGDHNENGGWPPHLHFQLILDLEGLVGDYPGVSSSEKIEFYKINCPDPSQFITNS